MGFLWISGVVRLVMEGSDFEIGGTKATLVVWISPVLQCFTWGVNHLLTLMHMK